ncbi:hypothetical protein KC350_g80 [Hortaea werneckii]|nr:hypothetical protein KC350_g80 [Hortaea werneckii]
MEKEVLSISLQCDASHGTPGRQLSVKRLSDASSILEASIFVIHKLNVDVREVKMAEQLVCLGAVAAGIAWRRHCLAQHVRKRVQCAQRLYGCRTIETCANRVSRSGPNDWFDRQERVLHASDQARVCCTHQRREGRTGCLEP